MQTDEASLIERSQRGDLDAFNALVVAYQGQVYSVCLRMLGSPQPAEDATQETFIAAFRAVSRFRRGSLRAWLLKIAANVCYDELRRRRSRPQLPLEATAGEERPAAARSGLSVNDRGNCTWGRSCRAAAVARSCRSSRRQRSQAARWASSRSATLASSSPSM